jgi:hypothetical protein
LGVDYVILSPVRPGEHPPWWVGTWRERFLRDDFEAFEPLRKAATDEAENSGRWDPVFESGMWRVYRRVGTEEAAKEGATDGPSAGAAPGGVSLVHAG